MSKFDRLVKSLPSLYQAETNTNIRGLLQAWGISDDNVELEIQNTKDQLYLATAGGRYLDYLANNFGVTRDPELGIGDDDFRKLVPIMAMYPKQVRNTLLSVLDVFWGITYTRANVSSLNAEPYDLGDEVPLSGTLIFIQDSKSVRGSGTAFTTDLEVGQYIKPTDSSGLDYAKISSIIDDENLLLSLAWTPDTAVNATAVFTEVATLEYEVDYGRDTRIIRIKPDGFADFSDITTEELVDYINALSEHNVNIIANSYTDPLLGVKLNITTNTPGLQGSMQILGGTANEVFGFSTDRQTETKCSVYEINPNEVIIKLPSSIPTLRRTLKGAAHLKDLKAEIFSEPKPFDFDSLGAASTLEITVDEVPVSITFTHSQFENPESVMAYEVVNVINAQTDVIQAFDISPLYRKRVGLRTFGGSLAFQVTGGTANEVLGFTTEAQVNVDMVQEDYPSAYLFDPINKNYTVTGTKTELNQDVEIGEISTVLALNDAGGFPNSPGKFMINFGRSNQEGPIKYNSRPNNSTLLIDASYVFQNQHDSDSVVNLVNDGPSIPSVTGSDYAFYVVGTDTAREAAQDLIQKLLASGVIIRFVIEYPEYLFTCTCRDCGPSDDVSQVGDRTALPPLEF